MSRHRMPKRKTRFEQVEGKSRIEIYEQDDSRKSAYERWNFVE